MQDDDFRREYLGGYMIVNYTFFCLNSSKNFFLDATIRAS